MTSLVFTFREQKKSSTLKKSVEDESTFVVPPHVPLKSARLGTSIPYLCNGRTRASLLWFQEASCRSIQEALFYRFSPLPTLLKNNEVPYFFDATISFSLLNIGFIVKRLT